MKLSVAGRNFLKVYETGGKMVSNRLVVLPKGEPALTTYRDDVGVLTIGWGHTGRVNGKTLTTSTTITRDQCEELLSMDLADTEHAVNIAIQDGARTNKNQFDAMVLITFNIGINAFNKSTLLKQHKAGNYRAAQAQFGLWNKGTVNGKKTVLNGLSRRRGEEATIYGRLSAQGVATIKTKGIVDGLPIYDQNASKRATPVEPEKLSTSPTIIGGVVAAITAMPVTVGSVQVATDSLRQVKEQAEGLQYFAWLSGALGVIIFILATYIIYKRWSDHKEGIK